MTELAVLVPVLDRPANVQPLCESWIATEPERSRLVFIATATDTDELAALDEENVAYHTTYAVTWPQKINYAVNAIDAEWYLFGADDISFTEGWFDAAMKVHEETGARVIGTNDLANPRVMAGEHSTHTLVKSTYIEEQGTIDADEAVCGFYHHWCVDDELLWTAKIRGEWAMALDAHVPAKHPYWQTAEMDDTYRRGEAHAAEDMALWKQHAKDLLGLDVT